MVTKETFKPTHRVLKDVSNHGIPTGTEVQLMGDLREGPIHVPTPCKVWGPIDADNLTSGDYFIVLYLTEEGKLDDMPIAMEELEALNLYENMAEIAKQYNDFRDKAISRGYEVTALKNDIEDGCFVKRASALNFTNNESFKFTLDVQVGRTVQYYTVTMTIKDIAMSDEDWNAHLKQEKYKLEIDKTIEGLRKQIKEIEEQFPISIKLLIFND